MQIKLIQKLTLACSLCLTVVVIIFTVTRASGLEWQGKLDVLWEVYFQIVAAEVGLILAAMTAFRALFVSRTAQNQLSAQDYPSFLMKGKSALKRLLDPRRWMYSKDTTGVEKHGTTNNGFDGRLPNIPGAAITGMHTFINQQGGAAESEIDSSTHTTSTEANQDPLPFSKHAPISRSHGQNASHHP